MSQQQTNTEPSLLFSEAVLAVKLGQNDLARGLFNRILKSDPKHEQALLWSAALCRRPTEAIRLLERVLKINPSNQQASSTLSLLQLNGFTGELDVQREAEEEEAHGPSLSGPTWICPLCGMHDVGSPEQCDKCGAVIDVTDLEGIGRNRRTDEALLLGALQRWEQAERYAKTYEGQLNMARVYLNLRRSHEAIPHLRKALELRGEDRGLRAAIDHLISRPLVMAVDDSMTIRRIVPFIIETAGYRAMTACDGEDALAKLQDPHSPPGLILMDVEMPGMNGYQVTRALRQLPHLRKVPVVVLSGGLLDKIRGRLAGVNDYVPKPFDPELLRATMRKYLAKAPPAL